nr:DUF1684 domain-containing protein [Xylanibacterium ulmi]
MQRPQQPHDLGLDRHVQRRDGLVAHDERGAHRDRARDPFEGVDTYPYDPSWILSGRYEPNPVGATAAFEHLRDGGRTRTHDAPGQIVVRVGEADHRLTTLDNGDTLLVVFADATTGSETYGAGRFLHVALPEGERDRTADVVLDFNRAVVPPCGFSDQFNCPLAPPSNRFATTPVRAGEKKPRFATA